MDGLPIKMMTTYLERRLVDIDRLRQSLENGSVDEFNRIGHQLKGNARSFGFDELEPLGLRMEMLGSDGQNSLVNFLITCKAL